MSLRDLILAPRHALVRDLMERTRQPSGATDDREAVARMLARYDFLAVPVVDDQCRLVGIVTHDDVIDVVQQEATEDLQRQGGRRPDRRRTTWRRASSRVWRKPGVLAVAAVRRGTVHVHRDVALRGRDRQAWWCSSLFVPLCISTGGNSGSQAATLVTRAMALGQVDRSRLEAGAAAGAVMGVALGVTLGVIGFVRGAADAGATPGAGRRRCEEPFSVRVPAGRRTRRPSDRDGTVATSTAGRDRQIVRRGRTVRTSGLPEGVSRCEPQRDGESASTSSRRCEVRTKPVEPVAAGAGDRPGGASASACGARWSGRCCR